MNIQVDTSQLQNILDKAKEEVNELVSLIYFIQSKYPFFDINVELSINEDKFMNGIDVRTVKNEKGFNFEVVYDAGS